MGPDYNHGRVCKRLAMSTRIIGSNLVRSQTAGRLIIYLSSVFVLMVCILKLK